MGTSMLKEESEDLEMHLKLQVLTALQKLQAAFERAIPGRNVSAHCYGQLCLHLGSMQWCSEAGQLKQLCL